MADAKITALGDLPTPAAADLFVMVDDTDTTTKKATLANTEAVLTHDNLIAGTIASHDTTATGTELDTLTDGSDSDALHAHAVNDAKVTNATHSGDVTGSGALTIGAAKVTEAMQVLADNTTQDFSITKHGYVPKGTNAGDFLKDDGTWGAPAGSGDVTAAANLTDNTILTGDGGVKGIQDTQVTLSDAGVLDGLISAKIETAGATDPEIIFETTNTAHKASMYLDESSGDTDLDIVGETAGQNMEVSIRSVDGQNSGLRLYSGDTNFTNLYVNSTDDFILKNTIQDKDISFKFMDAAVEKTIFIDASANEFNVGDTDIVTTGLVDGIDIATDVAANTLKDTNVTTNLSMGTVDGTQFNINSSDGTNVSLPIADTNNWGLISDEIFDEIAVNTAHAADNTQAHTDYLLNSGADVAVGPLTVTADNSTADQAYIPMVLYNTDDTPPAASGFPVGTLYVQYTA